jgi:hypothetical protein
VKLIVELLNGVDSTQICVLKVFPVDFLFIEHEIDEMPKR